MVCSCERMGLGWRTLVVGLQSVLGAGKIEGSVWGWNFVLPVPVPMLILMLR
jgi:hypothetical protein